MASVKVNYGKDGSIVSYRLRADLGRDSDGKQIIKTQTVKSAGGTPAKELKAMQRRADEWEQGLKNQLIPMEEKPFGQFLQDDFFGVHVHSGELKNTTIAFYQNMAPRVVNFFGNTPLVKITAMDIEKFLNHLRAVQQDNGKPLSQSTIRHYYTFLKIVFNFAERHDLLIRNPMLKVSPPKAEKKPVEFFTQQEAQEFLDALKTAPIRWQALMTLLISTGLRRGEGVGLQWQDVDYNAASITVRRNVTYTPGQGISVGTPKSTTGNRNVPVTSGLIRLLKSWQKEQAAPHGGNLLPTAFVFSDIETPYAPLRPDRITRWLRRFEQQHGLKEMSPHDLRHTAASLLLSGGASLKTTQAILGHADASTTLDFYAGVVQDDLREAANEMEAALNL